MRHQTLWCVALVLALGSTESMADDAPLTLGDLSGYQAALSRTPEGSIPRVTFRDLWDRPEAYERRLVEVEGKVARLFRQGKYGEFPPLVEVWVVSTAGDPFCLVFPQGEGQAMPEVGASVRFSGTFLRRIQYQGGDTARLALCSSARDRPPVSSSKDRCGH